MILFTFDIQVYVYTPYIRLVKFQLVRQIPDVYACVLTGKLILLFFLVSLYFSQRFQKKIIIDSLVWTPTHLYIQVSWSAYPWIGENIAQKS